MKSEDLGNKSAASQIYPELYSYHYRKVFERGIRNAGSPRQPARAVLSAMRHKRPATRYG